MPRGSLTSTPQTLLAPGANGWQGCHSYHDVHISFVLAEARIASRLIIKPRSCATAAVERMQTSASDLASALFHISLSEHPRVHDHCEQDRQY